MKNNFWKDKFYPSIAMIALFLLAGIVLSEPTTNSEKQVIEKAEYTQPLESKEVITIERTSNGD